MTFDEIKEKLSDYRRQRMRTVFVNRFTGDVLTYSEAKKQFREKYDGDDPTNLFCFDDYYEKIVKGEPKEDD